jgi:hypothetical protein
MHGARLRFLDLPLPKSPRAAAHPAVGSHATAIDIESYVYAYTLQLLEIDIARMQHRRFSILACELTDLLSFDDNCLSL